MKPHLNMREWTWIRFNSSRRDFVVLCLTMLEDRIDLDSGLGWGFRLSCVGVWLCNAHTHTLICRHFSYIRIYADTFLPKSFLVIRGSTEWRVKKPFISSSCSACGRTGVNRPFQAFLGLLLSSRHFSGILFSEYSGFFGFDILKPKNAARFWEQTLNFRGYSYQISNMFRENLDTLRNNAVLDHCWIKIMPTSKSSDQICCQIWFLETALRAWV